MEEHAWLSQLLCRHDRGFFMPSFLGSDNVQFAT